MTLLRESYLCHLFLALASAYEDSALRRVLAALGRWCSRQIGESAVLRPLCREGAVARAWETSVLCRLLSFLLNLPALLLHKLYSALPEVFDSSVFSRLLFAAGGETAAAQSWLVMLLWTIPFSRWNNAYSLMGFSLLLALFYAGAMSRRDFRLDVAAAGFYPAALFAATCLGLAFSYAPALSQRFLLYHVSSALCVLVTVSAVRREEDLKRLAAGGGFCVLVSSLYGVYQRIQGVEVNLSYVDVKVNPGMPGRVESFFDNPNTFAEVLILLLPLVLALALCSRSLPGRLAAGGVFAAGMAALGMTYSRASWVGMACAMVVMVFLWRPRLLPLFAALCVLCIPFLPSSIWNRILSIGNFSDLSTRNRLPTLLAALEMIRRRPVLGVGLGAPVPKLYASDWNLYHADFPYVHSHNFYLEVWLQTGLLGVVSFVGALLWSVKRAARAVRRRPPSAARTITCAAAASICGIMVCGLADYPWHYPRVMVIFWFVFSMALAGAKIC